MKNYEKKKIKIHRKGSPSCALLNSTKAWFLTGGGTLTWGNNIHVSPRMMVQ